MRMQFLFVAVIALTCRVALADDTTEARRHFQRGMADYNLNDFKRSIIEFQEAYRLHPAPEILFNLAQAYRGDGDREKALALYHSYLREADHPPNRDEVERRIVELDRELRLHPTPKPTPPVVETPPPSKPPAAVTPQPPPPHPELVVTKAPAPPRPAYKKWWVWTLVGVGAAGAAVGIYFGAASTQNRTYPSVTF
jgi:tetratricopeptide (TPR) repeat protein